MNDLKSIDLFSGAGGLSEGLERAGFHTLFASEIVPCYAQTFRFNHPDTLVSVDDIRKVDPDDIRNEIGIKIGELDLIAGGPPCQGFSINAPVRSTGDPRNHLFLDYLRFVRAFQPKAVLIENVPGLVSFNHGDTLHAILSALADLGYGAGVNILGAPFYGVPQMRWRTIILGLRGADIPQAAWPEPVKSAPIRTNFTTTFDDRTIVKWPQPGTSESFVTIFDAISDLPELENGERGAVIKQYASEPRSSYQAMLRESSPGVFNHEAQTLSDINMRRLAHIRPGGNWTEIPMDLLPKGMRRAKGTDHTKRYGRPRWEDMSSTILTKCDPHWGAFFHPEQNRAFTVREAARIQSFPDHYIFTGSQAEQYAQVGNAVPPLLGKAVGRSLIAALQGGER